MKLIMIASLDLPLESPRTNKERYWLLLLPHYQTIPEFIGRLFEENRPTKISAYFVCSLAEGWKLKNLSGGYYE